MNLAAIIDACIRAIRRTTMSIRIDKEARRASNDKTGLSIAYLDIGIIPESQAHFRFEQNGEVIDFTASYTSSANRVLRSARGLSPLEKMERLRSVKDITYTIDVDPLKLRTAKEVEDFVRVFTAAASIVGEKKQISVSIYGANLPKALWRGDMASLLFAHQLKYGRPPRF